MWPSRDFEQRVHEGLADYRESLSDERRVLLDRYRLEDCALKVVGIGSVGTRCYIGLLFSEDGHPLILQFKEAVRSVLEPYAGESAYDNQGQRVVVGQRLMQSSSDIFLGWVRGRRGHDFFVRQLRDMKMSMPVDGFSAAQLRRYARICGWTLARAHAKSGDAATISGYLGKGDAFDRALAEFAVAYADQTQHGPRGAAEGDTFRAHRGAAGVLGQAPPAPSRTGVALRGRPGVRDWPAMVPSRLAARPRNLPRTSNRRSPSVMSGSFPAVQHHRRDPRSLAHRSRPCLDGHAFDVRAILPHPLEDRQL